MGKALLARNTGPVPEIIRDLETGLLCDPLNPRDIADKTIKVLQNSNLRLKLGHEARRDVETRFSIDKILAQNIKFYQNLLEE